MIVVDASVVLELLLRTRAAEAIEHRALHPGSTLHCPHLLDVEVLQVVRRYALAGELDERRATHVLDDLRDLPLTRYPHEPFIQRIFELRNNLTACDAAYVALAETMGVPLLTCDKRLASAPGHAARVELL